MADFGLSEDIYTNAYYQQRKSDTAVKLPVRWMPPESIEYGIFTEKSDVVSATNTVYKVCIVTPCFNLDPVQWSFGVICWEVFTGGQIPYSGICPITLLQLLCSGKRLSKPMNPACSEEM